MVTGTSGPPLATPLPETLMKATVTLFTSPFLNSLRFHLPTLETERFRKTPFIKLFSKVFVFISVFGSDPGWITSKLLEVKGNTFAVKCLFKAFTWKERVKQTLVEIRVDPARTVENCLVWIFREKNQPALVFSLKYYICFYINYNAPPFHQTGF